MRAPITDQAAERVLVGTQHTLGHLREHESTRMLDTLLANLDGMVYRCRYDRHWTMEFVSEGCYRLTGYQPAELLLNQQRSYESITDPEDRQTVRDLVADALHQRQRFDLEYRIVHADGERRWVWERGVGVFDAGGALLAIEGIIQDITARKQAFQALREAERRYHSLFDNAIEGIFRTTPEGRYLDANPALARIYGFDSTEELASSLRDIRAQLYVDPERRSEFMRIVKARGSISGFESQVYRKNGDIIWISENARAVIDNGVVLHYEGTVEDVTERKLYEARIQQQANYDTLTGLANRSLLNDRLQQSIMTAATYGTRLAVVFVDLDRFKYINDSLGHHVGDQLLCVMSQRLRACVRDSDTVARLGGDEFVLLLNGLSETDNVAGLMERMLLEIAAPWTTQNGEFDVTCSVGVALYPDDGSDAQTLLKHADSAMYRAKERGRNNFQFFTTEINTQMTERLELETGLRRALERDQFCLYYQPRIDLKTGAITGAEALIRWRVSDTEMVQPGRFIPLAEETGLIVPMGQWALREACRQNQRWRQAGLPSLVVAVNVSLRQFQRDDFLHTITDALHESGLSAGGLEIEVTESSVMHNAERLIDMLCDIKALGIHISVDDFGTGYSSLSYLKRFPVDRLKIDRSFVQDILLDKDGETIVRTIIALGHNLGLKVVAEGVESIEQIDYLRDNGCDELQGFYYGHPMSAEEFEQLLRTGTVRK